MANVKITDLTAYTDAASTDVMPIVDISNDVTKKISISDLLKAAPLGSAAAPGVAFDGDPNTGIYSPGADQVAISTAGNECLRITSAGLVGIGTSSPNSTLDVRGIVNLGDPTASGSARKHFVFTGGAVTSDTTNGLTFKPGSAATTDQFVRFETGGGVLVGAFGAVGDGLSVWTRDISNALTITQAGRLGIGTTSPGAVLDCKVTSSKFIRITDDQATSNTGVIRCTESDGTNRGMGVAGNFIAFLQGADNTSAITERARIDSSGRLLVGTSSAVVSSTKLQVGSTSGTSNNVLLGNNGTESLVLYFVQTGLTSKSISCTTNDRINVFSNNDTSTGVYLTAGGTSWTSTSDERLKENLEPITDGLAKVSNLRCVVGNYINDPAKKRMPFLIAQDVGQVLPEAVDSTDPGELGLSYTGLIPLLVAALKESKERIEQLEAAVTALQQS